MQIILYGATENGYMIASQLCADHDVILIDEAEHLPEKFTGLDISQIVGSGADIAALQKLNIEEESLFVACTVVDEANIVACWTIKKISDMQTVCFVSRPEIYQNLQAGHQSSYQTRYDVDTTLWPERLLTEDIFRILTVPEALDVEYFDDRQVQLFEYRIKEDTPLCNKKLMDYAFPADVLVVGVTRGETLSVPDGQYRIQVDDKVIFMGTEQGLDLLAADFFAKKSQIASAAVIGGGNVGYSLAEKMEQIDIKVKIIELDEKRCVFLADRLQKSLVLQGDGTDLELLEEESIGGMDVVVCVTSNDEKNLLCSLLAKQLGVQRIITRTNSEQNAKLFAAVGVDVVVSPMQSTMTELLNLVQARSVDILAFVAGGLGEVLQLTVDDGFVPRMVMDCKLPKNAIIGLIKREKQIVVPNGQTTVYPGDLLKIFTLAGNSEAVQAVFAL
ncbi:MAG: Trk system potassium transporter TrkA [Deltaproteobacteria bacterium]|nr:MAG: Trk system potassium transporter TrkA [Deltaproteobacteria bacterium]